MATERGNFKQFFFRGLGILLPTVLTIWILIAAYQFVRDRIAAPINGGLRYAVVELTEYPRVTHEEVAQYSQFMTPAEQRQYAASGESRAWLEAHARLEKLERWWASYAFPMDLIGLAVAVVLIYVVGLALGSYIGRRLYARGEELINRVPLVRRVYPSVKQLTDFVVGEKNEQRPSFSRVVGIEYPRKGLWSVGLVTGETMRGVELAAGEECLTVFVPSAPTPFTGYVVTIKKSDTIDLSMSVEDAIKFCVSGGVVIPPSQRSAPPAR